MSKANTRPLTPRLICKDAKKAIDFYVQALGAKVLEQFEDKHLGIIVHSALEVNGGIFAVVDSAPDWGNHSPSDIGGTAVLMQLIVDDPDTTGKQMEQLGAEVVFPIADQFYGHREGRLRDPFGHLWMITKIVEELSPEEIQRRVDSFHDAG